MRFSFLFLTIGLFLFTQPAFSYEGVDYFDSTMVLSVSLNDTLKAMAVFSWARDGIQNDTMKVMYPWTQSIWNLADSGSIPNYYLQNSFNKHMLVGESVPSGDSMFVSNIDLNLGSYYSFSEDYFHDIMAQADSLYDFTDFDLTGPNGIPDGKVDMLMFIICNWTQGGRADLNSHTYTSEENISVGDGVICFIFNKDYQLGANFYDGGRPRSQRVMMHEYNHLLGTPDTEHSGFTYSHHYALGGFGLEVYGGTQFNGILGPLNPYWRKNKMHWISGNEIIHVPIYNKPLQYWSENDTSVLILSNPNVVQNQNFYLSAHKRTTYFDQYWPSPDSGGLMVYHVRPDLQDQWFNSLRDARKKPIDVFRSVRS
jgi:M6 family metalloprotease-like protein